MSGARLTRLVAMSLTLGLAAWLVPPETLAQGARPAQAPPSPVAGRILSLQEAIDIALENQPSIQARLGDYAAARQRVDQAFSGLLPQIGGSWNALRDQTAKVGETSATTGRTGPTITSWGTTTTAKVTLSQLLFDFGKTFAATDREKANAESSKEDVEIDRNDTVLLVKESYFNLLFGKRLVVVNQEAVARAELNLRSAKGFFEVGTRPKFDVTRAEVDLANSQLTLIQARNAVRLARVALNTAMGISATAPTEVQDILTYEAFPVDESRLLAEALQRRPEYRQIKARVEAAEASVRQNFRNFFPDVTSNAWYGANRADMNEIWELGVTLNWSIFDGGNKIAKYKEAKASLEAAQARVRVQELAIWKEVEQAYLNVIEGEERIQAAKKAVESAQENFRLAQGRFDAGVGTIIELTDAQLELTQAQSREANALTDYRIAVSRLERSLGRR
ncbi:MAG: type I secretion outer membrane protein [Candidatus Rokubacteria bacterium CSP1-6]|nr:MAG: type I secretion outer membrane protein [Candidatus Rokubacteria bacterium CSP1-6]